MFGATMSLDRFRFLSTHIRFDDKQTRNERWRRDKFCAARDLFDTFFQQCIKVLGPGDYLTIDETLYPTRGAFGFKQYNPNKPAKYGMLFRSLNSVRFPYTYMSLPYSGRAEDGSSNEYNIFGPDKLIEKLVEDCRSH